MLASSSSGSCDLDNVDTEQASAHVVGITRMLGNNDLVSETGHVRHLLRLLRIGTRDTGGRCRRNGSRASSGHCAPIRTGDRSQTSTYRSHQLVQIYVVARSLLHGLLDFRQGKRAADDRVGAFAIDQRPHTDCFIQIGTDGTGAGTTFCA